MTHSNIAIIEGFITHDAALDYSQKTGKPFILFSLAINHYPRPGEPGRVSFVEVEIWNKLAIAHKDKIKKGQRVIVSGVLEQDRWKEKEETRSRITIYADDIQFK